MARSKKDGPDPEVIAKRRRSKAYEIRKLVKSKGHPLSKEGYDAALENGVISKERHDFILGYEKEPHGNERSEDVQDGGAGPDATDRDAIPPAPGAEGSSPPDGDGNDAARGGEAGPPILPPTPPAPPRIAPPPPSPPPRVPSAPVAPGKSGNWRDEYKWIGGIDGSGQDPREIACNWLAKYWWMALKEMENSIRVAGLEPWFNPDHIRGALVLTVDKVLPADFELTPEVVAGVGTTAIAGQRFVYAKKIKEALLSEKGKQEHTKALNSIKERAAESQSTAPVPKVPPSPTVEASTPPEPPRAPATPAMMMDDGEHEESMHEPCPVHGLLWRHKCATCDQGQFAALDTMTREPARSPDGTVIDHTIYG